MNAGPREWDAQTYDRVSDPQFHWGVEVLERLDLDGDEYVMDAGCGSGRVTARLLERLPNGRVLCVDASESMIAKAREALGDRADYLVADLAELKIERPVDVIFSTATFHWVPDHDRLFSRLHAALRPGGHLVAQCGGEGNVARHARNIITVATRPEFIEHFEGMDMMWNFAPPDETEERLRRAGFEHVKCWLEDKPVQPEHPYDFTTTVTMGPHLARLPEDLRRSFAEAVLELEDEPLVLNYVRLNIDARRA
ncbi:MAG TPA: methyltransferase domain-containing protein [Solirubrobacterales bacterium]|jgi:trans-aconitate 2-methyltransferase